MASEATAKSVMKEEFSDDELDDHFEEDLQEMLRNGPAISTDAAILGGDLSETSVFDSTASYNPTTSMTKSVSMPVSSPGQRPSSASTGSSSQSSASRMGTGGAQVSSVKLSNLKTWGMSTFKFTKQMLSEKIGRASKTVDLQLGTQIETLRDTQKKYSTILEMSRLLGQNFQRVVQTQRALGDCFADMSDRSPELRQEFDYNAKMQKTLCRNGEILLGAINHFVYTVNTLCNKTMEDSMMTIRLYENARIEYDAYRSEYESVKNLAPRDPSMIPRIEQTRIEYENHRKKFESLKEKVTIKLKFLDENKVTVMHRQLLLFHNAVAAYFSGNQTELDEAIKAVKLKLSQSLERKTFLEVALDSPESPRVSTGNSAVPDNAATKSAAPIAEDKVNTNEQHPRAVTVNGSGDRAPSSEPEFVDAVSSPKPSHTTN